MTATLIIAEAGVNHNGDEQLAYQLIDAAKAAGADIVKFQTFVTEELVTKDAGQASYQTENTGKQESQFSMLKRLELDFDCHKRLQAYCQTQGIAYLSTAFDLKSLVFLSKGLGLEQLKIPSGEITNAPYLLAHARTGCKLIVSTGMASIEEIHQALSILAFGFANANGTPSAETLTQLYHSEFGQNLLREHVTLLHCTTEYPAPLADINLDAMELMRSEFNLPVGYSDHTQGILVPTIAAAKRATVIEKHFTLSRDLPGPDHQASIEPDELKELVNNVRAVELALGKAVKQPSAQEYENKAVIRKSLVAAKDIKKGEQYTEHNIAIKRPGNGLSPFLYWDLIGCEAKQDYIAGQLLEQ